MENPPTIKKFNVTGVSIPNGIRITYPNADNKVHDIDNPLETFIASLAACITTMLRMFAKNKNFKLGQIAWTRIESSLDLSLLKSAGGPGNKINDIFMDAEIETSLSEQELGEVKKQVESVCPAFQMITASGVKINEVWKHKPLNE